MVRGVCAVIAVAMTAGCQYILDIDPPYDPGPITGTDAGDVSGDAKLATCDDLYGEAPGYQLCEEHDAECHFRAELGGVASCADVCAGQGGECVRQFGNDTACVKTVEEPCDQVGSRDDICVCTRARP